MSEKLEHDIIVDLPSQIEKFFEIMQFDMEEDNF
jgi:hypothetical protein